MPSARGAPPVMPSTGSGGCLGVGGVQRAVVGAFSDAPPLGRRATRAVEGVCA